MSVCVAQVSAQSCYSGTSVCVDRCLSPVTGASADGKSDGEARGGVGGGE